MKKDSLYKVKANSHHTYFINEQRRIANVTSDRIIHMVCKYYEVHLRDLMGSSRYSEYAYPRQVAMFLCRKLTKLSYPQLAEKFNRDHTTILHNVRKIEHLLNNKAQEDIIKLYEIISME